MCCSFRTGLTSLFAAGVILLASGCGDRWVEVPGGDGAVKSSAEVRAERRAYDGAPPVIPHDSFGGDCSACHDSRGTAVAGVGYAPASPHDDSPAAGNTQRCRQCHVFSSGTDLFAASNFEGLNQDMRVGGRLNPISPPTIPHRILMRESCVACHAGPAAREEIRTTHPERTRCRQCHVEITSRSAFESQLGAELVVADTTDTNPE